MLTGIINNNMCSRIRMYFKSRTWVEKKLKFRRWWKRQIREKGKFWDDSYPNQTEKGNIQVSIELAPRQSMDKVSDKTRSIDADILDIVMIVDKNIKCCYEGYEGDEIEDEIADYLSELP